ncbi:MAG: ATP-dependent endonuclease [Acidimicrobiia bacterium]|nr:ATP-dependent endonuclease [Acidimicrobiia bacterium]
MDRDQHRRLAREARDGYVKGPDAPIEAAAAALAKAEAARSVMLVEGISDQIALETLAGRQGRNLEAERIVIVPVGGAQAIPRYLGLFGPQGKSLPITGMCDAGEELLVRRGLSAGGLGSPRNRLEMEQLGFFVCVDDLEQELIRASDRAAIEALLESQGDLSSFRTMQNQPAWRGRGFEAQLHRWIRAGARRNLRYAHLLTLSLRPDRLPRPLEAVLAATGAQTEGAGR